MDFGRVASADGIDFGFPPPDPASARWLAGDDDGAPLRVYTGAPLWTERAWLGSVYPAGTAPRDFLAAYARAWPAIEHNGTFYAVPTAQQVERWAAVLPPGFQFCPKVPQTISHTAEWRDDAARFVAVAAGFGAALGPAFFQLPPDVEASYLPGVLERLDALAPLPLALEVRHPSWFRDRRLLPRAVDALGERGVIGVLCDTPGRRDVAHVSLTGPRLFVRWRGADGHPSDGARLQAWAERLAEWRSHGVREVWFFVHQRGFAELPPLLAHLHRALNRAAGTNLPEAIGQPW